MTPRKRHKKPVPDIAPNYKLWQFCIKPKDKITKPYYILWCEKGINSNGQPSDFFSDFIYPIYNDNIVQEIVTQYSYGEVPDTSHDELSRILNENSLSIEDYSFLAPFMDDKYTALELWPDNCDLDSFVF